MFFLIWTKMKSQVCQTMGNLIYPNQAEIKKLF